MDRYAESKTVTVSYLHDEAEGIRRGDGSPSDGEWCVQVVVQTGREVHLSPVLQGAEGVEVKEAEVKKCGGYEEL